MFLKDIDKIFIKNVEIKNFKSFKEIKADFKRYNILIGANASGKTNFIKFLMLISDLQYENLENVIQLQGGPKYFTNLLIKDRVFSSIVKFQIIPASTFGNNSCGFDFYFKEIEHFIKIKFDNKLIPHIESEKIKLSSDCYYYYFKSGDHFRKNLSKANRKNVKSLDFNFEAIFKRKKLSEYDKGNLENFILKKNIGGLENDLKNCLKKIKEINHFKKDEFLLNRFLYAFGIYSSSIEFYDFNPNLLKSSTSTFGKINLRRDGKNINIVINKILNDDTKKKTFINLLNYVFPFITDIKTNQIDINNIKLNLKENFINSYYIPSELASDGTIYIMALIIVLFFEKNSIVILEEPEKFIHPALISSLMTLIKDASKFKQIFITTHSPEIVRHSDVENIFLISRDDKGFSNITKPIDREDVKVFLQNELGLADLFVDNVL